MTVLSRILSFFPAATALLMIASFISWMHAPSIGKFFLMIYFIYGFPLTVYQIHRFFYPNLEGRFQLNNPKKYSPWWGAHQIQLVYGSFSFLETLLKLIPGMFSLWLRLWGSEVGKSVYWTPHVEIVDRGLMKIEDGVIFGHRVICSSHLISKKSDKAVLWVKKITIGEGTFVGALSRISPGVQIAAHAFIPADSSLYPNVFFSSETLKEEALQ